MATGDLPDRPGPSRRSVRRRRHGACPSGPLARGSHEPRGVGATGSDRAAARRPGSPVADVGGDAPSPSADRGERPTQPGPQAPSHLIPATRGRSWLGPVLLALAGTVAFMGMGTGSSPAPPPPDLRAESAPDLDPELVARGRALYGTGCVSCHGPDGQGQSAPDGRPRGPTLAPAGAAGAYYQLTTGRMPLADPRGVPARQAPAYAPDEIEALVAFVASLGDGPALPAVDIDRGDLAQGGVLYRENCQACHSATGAGGALSYGRAAPPLAVATPEQVGAAVRSGPGPMPRFGEDILTDHQLDSVARYVAYLEHPDDRGGLALGRLGPIPEGFVVWVGALGLLLVAAYFMGTRWATARRVDPVPPGEPDPDDVARATPVSTAPDAVTPDDDPAGPAAGPAPPPPPTPQDGTPSPQPDEETDP